MAFRKPPSDHFHQSSNFSSAADHSDISQLSAPAKPIWDKSPKGAAFVQHLLNNNGPEHYIDYAALRHELEVSESAPGTRASSPLNHVSGIDLRNIDIHKTVQASQFPASRVRAPERARSPISERQDLDFGADGLGGALSAISKRSRLDPPPSAQHSSPVHGRTEDPASVLYRQASARAHATRSPSPTRARVPSITKSMDENNPSINQHTLARPQSPRSSERLDYSRSPRPQHPYPQYRIPSQHAHDRPPQAFRSAEIHEPINVTSPIHLTHANQPRTPLTDHAQDSADTRKAKGYTPGSLPIPEPPITPSSMQPISQPSTPIYTQSTPITISSFGATPSLSTSLNSRDSEKRDSTRRRGRNSCIRSLQDLSNFLVSKGQPPLPDEILNTPVSQGLQVSLDHAVSQIFAEYHRRGDVIQHLLRDIQDSNVRDEVARNINRSYDTNNSDSTSKNQANKDAGSRTNAAAAEATKLNVKYEQMMAAKERCESEASLLRQELTSRLDKDLQRQRQAQSTFATVHSQYQKPGHGALDHVTAEIMDVYESKLSGMQKELDNLRKVIRKSAEDGDEGRGLYTPPPAPETEPASEQFIRLKHALEQQILLLQKRLEQQTQATKRVEEERDLLKLQLLNIKKPPSVTKGSSNTHTGEPGGSIERESTRKAPIGSTRDLIRRDKLNYKLRLYLVDEMPADNVRDLVKDMCIRLSVSDPRRLVPALGECSKVLRLVPKMQAYIRDIDALVWRKSLNSVKSGGSRSENKSGALEDPKDTKALVHMHKTKDTYKVLTLWVSELDVLRHIREWLSKLIKHLGILDADSNGGVGTQVTDTDAELQIVEEIRRLVAFEKNTNRVGRQMAREAAQSTPISKEVDVETYQRIVAHYCNLFDVKSLSACVPKLNELFSFVMEMDAGVLRLRQVLGMPDLSPSIVLHHAADSIAARNPVPSVNESHSLADSPPFSSDPPPVSTTTPVAIKVPDRTRAFNYDIDSDGTVRAFSTAQTSPTGSSVPVIENGDQADSIWSELGVDDHLLDDISGLDVSSMGSFSGRVSASTDSIIRRRLEQVRMMSTSDIADNIDRLVAQMEQDQLPEEKYFMADDDNR